MPKMSLLTELWKVGLRGLQRCHAYGVAGKPPMPQGFLGTMHHPWWLVSPAEPPPKKARLEDLALPKVAHDWGKSTKFLP